MIIVDISHYRLNVSNYGQTALSDQCLNPFCLLNQGMSVYVCAINTHTYIIWNQEPECFKSSTRQG